MVKFLLVFNCSYVSRPISDIFSVKLWHNVETWVWGRSRLLKMMPFIRSHTTFLWSAVVSISIFYTVFELFDV